MVIRRANADDANAPAVVAAATFPFACPPPTTEAAELDVIATELSQERVDDHLADPEPGHFGCRRR